MKKNKIYSLIFQEDDLRWQTIIYELIRTGKIDPWDIDISLFSKEYLKMIEKLKELNFRISGKVVLAAAILLRMKTNRLGLQEFLGLIEEPEQELKPELDEFEDEFSNEVEQKIEKLANHIKHNTKKKIILDPRLDRKRERKVTVFELMSALKKAMEVDERRKERHIKIQVQNQKPEFKIKKIDIMGKIRQVYERLIVFFKKYRRNTVEFTQIIPSNKKKDIIWTFVPLLHLANQGKIEIMQSKPFGKLHIHLKDKDFIKKENM